MKKFLLFSVIYIFCVLPQKTVAQHASIDSAAINFIMDHASFDTIFKNFSQKNKLIKFVKDCPELEFHIDSVGKKNNMSYIIRNESANLSIVIITLFSGNKKTNFILLTKPGLSVLIEKHFSLGK